MSHPCQIKHHNVINILYLLVVRGNHHPGVVSGVVAGEGLAPLSKLSDPLRAVHSWRVAAAFGIDPQLSSPPVLLLGPGGDDGVHVLGAGELHHDVVTGGLALGTALPAGGQSAAVGQSCSNSHRQSPPTTPPTHPSPAGSQPPGRPRGSPRTGGSRGRGPPPSGSGTAGRSTLATY